MDSYYGPRLKKKADSSICVPTKEVEELLVRCGKMLGIEYIPKEEIPQKKEE